MKKILLACSIAASLMAAPVWAAPLTKTFVLKKHAFSGKLTRLPPGAFDEANPGDLIPGVSLADITGRITEKFTSEDFMVDPQANHLVIEVILWVDPEDDETETTYTNLEWTIEERSAADACISRPGPEGSNSCGIFEGEARVFTSKSISGLAKSKWTGVTTIAETDGSRGGPIPLGDHEATSQVQVKLDSQGEIKSISFPGGPIFGWADILDDPENDEDNLTFKMKIKTAEE